MAHKVIKALVIFAPRQREIEPIPPLPVVSPRFSDCFKPKDSLLLVYVEFGVWVLSDVAEWVTAATADALRRSFLSKGFRIRYYTEPCLDIDIIPLLRKKVRHEVPELYSVGKHDNYVDIWRWSTKKYRWEWISDLYRGKITPAFVVMGRDIVFMDKDVYKFNTVTETWQMLIKGQNDENSNESALAALKWKNKILVIDEAGSGSSMLSTLALYGGESEILFNVKMRKDSTVAISGDWLYIFDDEPHMVNLVTGAEMTLEKPFIPRRGAKAAVWRGGIRLYGGIDAPQKSKSEYYHFDRELLHKTANTTQKPTFATYISRQAAAEFETKGEGILLWSPNETNLDQPGGTVSKTKLHALQYWDAVGLPLGYGVTEPATSPSSPSPEIF